MWHNQLCIILATIFPSLVPKYQWQRQARQGWHLGTAPCYWDSALRWQLCFFLPSLSLNITFSKFFTMWHTKFICVLLYFAVGTVILVNFVRLFKFCFTEVEFTQLKGIYSIWAQSAFHTLQTNFLHPPKPQKVLWLKGGGDHLFSRSCP